MAFQLQLLTDESDFSVFRPDKEVLKVLFAYAKEKADENREKLPHPNNDEVFKLANAALYFIDHPWEYSNLPKCLSCERALTPLEKYNNLHGLCNFCGEKKIGEMRIVSANRPD